MELLKQIILAFSAVLLIHAALLVVANPIALKVQWGSKCWSLKVDNYALRGFVVVETLVLATMILKLLAKR